MALILSYRGRSQDAGEADVVLGDADVMPRQLSESSRDIDHLDIVDPLSFPFEDLSEEGWRTPMTVHLPSLPFGTVVALLDEPLLSRLTVLDSVVASDELWSRLQPYYGWPRSMLVDPVPSAQRYCVDLVERTAAVVENVVGRPSSTLSAYSGWALRSGGNKRRVMAIAEAIEQCVDESVDGLHRQPTIELHGCAIQPYLPVLWDGLSIVSDHLPAGHARLRHQYRRPKFRLAPAGEPAREDSADVVVGIGLGERGVDHAARSYRDLFLRTRVGGSLVVAERFHRDSTPDGLIERLLDASGNDLVLDRVEPIGAAEEGPICYAVVAVTKLGVPHCL